MKESEESKVYQPRNERGDKKESSYSSIHFESTFDALWYGVVIILLGFGFFTFFQSFPFFMLLMTVVLLLMLLVWLSLNRKEHESNHQKIVIYGFLFLIGLTLSISNAEWGSALSQTIQENPLNIQNVQW